ncbi:MAG: RING-HC finger protein, partial [archaeon]|nr:RING-HC finger protein [archaeon]
YARGKRARGFGEQIYASLDGSDEGPVGYGVSPASEDDVPELMEGLRLAQPSQEQADRELALYLAASDSREESGPSTSPKQGTGTGTGAGSSRRRDRVSLNHLIQFNVSQSGGDGLKSRGRGLRSSRDHSPQLMRLKKELYIQANHQVVLHHGGDYSKLLRNPDAPVAWVDISQLFLSSKKAYACPICLERPKVPRMTPCGHVFCWVCLLQLLSHGVTARTFPCPMCNEAVFINDLRSVSIHTPRAHEPGSQIELTLMRRHRHSTFLAPTCWWLSNAPPLPFVPSKDDPLAVFSRFATTSSISEVVEHESTSLQVELAESMACGDRSAPFIESAIAQLEHEHQQLKKRFDDRASTRQHLSASAELTALDDDPRNAFFFYQSSDGDLFFPEKLDVKILLAQFGDHSNLPPSLSCKILALRQIFVDHETRKAFPWLSHLPLSCPLHLVELELPPSFLSPAVVRQFKNELNDRKRRVAERLAASRPPPASPPASSSPTTESSSSSSSPPSQITPPSPSSHISAAAEETLQDPPLGKPASVWKVAPPAPNADLPAWGGPRPASFAEILRSPPPPKSQPTHPKGNPALLFTTHQPRRR